MADTSQQKDLIKDFCGVAGVNDDRARFYLESAAWNLDIALASFFDNNIEEADMAEYENVQRDASPSPQASGKPTASRKSTSQPSRFATIGSLKTEESDSSGEEGQAYYAGGSEHGGGQQIIGPSKKKKPEVDSLVTNMFRSAKEHGAEVVDDPAGAASHQSAAFRGRAYRLGDTEMQSQVVDFPVKEAGTGQVEMVLRLWQNGFSIDNGPLRDFHDPANQQLLQGIQRGEMPQELVELARGNEVHLNMEDHRHEDYVKPPNVIKPFAGAGHRLGCPSEPTASTSSSVKTSSGPSAAAAAPSAAIGSARENEAVAGLNINTSLPTTSLQIRLADGSRLIAKFNHSHLISDVRRYIITARPEYSTANFVLMTTFPNAELTEESASLVAANVLNAVIVQRMK